VDEIVKRLRWSPLAIKWYVQSVESGKEPHQLITNQDELLEFCVRTVYETLRGPAQTILAVLYAIDRDSTFDELAILTDLSIDGLRLAVHDLLSSSLASLEPDNENQLVSRVRLTEVARHFLRRVSPPSAQLVESVLGRERQLRESEEHRKADERARLLAPNVVRVQATNEQPVAYLLRLALLESYKGSLEQSLDYIQRARDLNADYWEVDRVEAFILSSAGRVEQATALYRSALRKTEGEGAAVVSYFFAGHLARKVRDTSQALDFARSAHFFFKSHETAQLLGNLLVWHGDFSEGQEYLESALEEASGKSRLIVLTSLVESWRRWAEDLTDNDRQMISAFHKAHAGYSLGSKEMRAGVYDVKLANSVLECCSSCISAVTTGSVEADTYLKPVVEFLEFINQQRLIFEKTKAWNYFPGYLGKLNRFERSTATMKRLCQNLLETSERKSLPATRAANEELVGRVKNWRDTFGFIQHIDFPMNVFFPGNAIENMTDRGDRKDLPQRQVRFRVDATDPDRPRATWVWVYPLNVEP
jgi:tetratricopeptide (TPR) repeat protein